MQQLSTVVWVPDKTDTKDRIIYASNYTLIAFLCLLVSSQSQVSLKFEAS